MGGSHTVRLHHAHGGEGGHGAQRRRDPHRRERRLARQFGIYWGHCTTTRFRALMLELPLVFQTRQQSSLRALSRRCLADCRMSREDILILFQFQTRMDWRLKAARPVGPLLVGCRISLLSHQWLLQRQIAEELKLDNPSMRCPMALPGMTP